MTLSKDKLLNRAAGMLVGEVIRIDGLTAPIIRKHLKSLRQHWDTEVRAKRYIVKVVPDPIDRDDLRRIVRGEIATERAMIMNPDGIAYVACGAKWPDYSGFPRRARPDLKPLAGEKTASMAKRKEGASAPVRAPQVDRPHVDEAQRHSDDYAQDVPNYDD